MWSTRSPELLSLMWLPLALVAAVFAALADITKKAAVADVHPTIFAFFAALASLALLAPIVLIQGVPEFGRAYVLAFVVSGSINILGTWLILRAYQLSDLSLVVPLSGLTPVFTLFIAALVLGERPSLFGLVGVLVVTVGTYVVSVRRGRDQVGMLEPLQALWRDRGARYMMLVALLYGVSSTYDKVGTLASSPMMWALSLQGVQLTFFGGWLLSSRLHRSAVRMVSRRGWLLMGLAGVFAVLTMYGQMTALTTGLAGYVIAVKRMSMLIAVLAGGLLFREQHTGVRLAGTLLILLGLIMFAVA